MSDILYDSAKSFERAMQYNYVLDVAKSKTFFIINLNCLKGEFTHIVGLDHLKSDEAFATKNTKIKAATFNKIINSEITYADISQNPLFNIPFRSTYNSATNSEYTLAERISALRNIEKLLDEIYKGNFYKWDSNKALVTMPNGSKRKPNITADYMIKIPSESNPNEYIYMFFYQEKTSSKSKNEPIVLHLHSAFADCVDLSERQERPFKILKEEKVQVSTKKSTLIYIHPKYKEQLEKEQAEAHNKSVLTTLAQQLSKYRQEYIISPDKVSQEQYKLAQMNFAEVAIATELYEYSINLLQNQLSNPQVSSELIKSIQQDIQVVKAYKDKFDTEKRSCTISFGNHSESTSNSPKMVLTNGATIAVNPIPKIFSFEIPIPPRKPFKALYFKIKEGVQKIVSYMKKKPDPSDKPSGSSGSGGGTNRITPIPDKTEDKSFEKQQVFVVDIPTTLYISNPNNSYEVHIEPVHIEPEATKKISTEPKAELKSQTPDTHKTSDEKKKLVKSKKSKQIEYGDD